MTPQLFSLSTKFVIKQRERDIASRWTRHIRSWHMYALDDSSFRLTSGGWRVMRWQTVTSNFVFFFLSLWSIMQCRLDMQIPRSLHHHIWGPFFKKSSSYFIMSKIKAQENVHKLVVKSHQTLIFVKRLRDQRSARKIVHHYSPWLAASIQSLHCLSNFIPHLKEARIKVWNRARSKRLFNKTHVTKRSSFWLMLEKKDDSGTLFVSCSLFFPFFSIGFIMKG